MVEIKDLQFSYPEPQAGFSSRLLGGLLRRSADPAPSASFQLSLSSLRLRRGERLAIHGPSGCGKSTLLDLIAGIQVPDSGYVRVVGQELPELDESARRAHRIRHLGFVFQDFPLVNYLDVLDNVLLPFRLTRALTLDNHARESARDLLEQLGLGHYGDRRPRELSQGERQRVAIARALVTDPALILADEPTAGLDPERSFQVLDLLQDLCARRDLGLILVSHEPMILDRFENRLSL